MCSAVLVASSGTALALEVPGQPLGQVSDFAGVLSADARARLEGQIARYTTGAHHQIAVALFRSLEGESLEDFSVRLAEKWRIGSKQNDDGVLITVFVEDRKLRIEVGYGLEDRLTDALSSRILREVITPRLRAGDMAGGLAAGIAAIDTAITGRSHEGEVPAPIPQRARRSRDSGWPGGLIVFVILILLSLFGGRRGRRHGGIWWMGGGGWSGGSGGWSSGSSGGFSGGGGSFGGGGASGSW